ncbi:MAG: protein-disulfide reductase DsbD, partial [Arenicellales bacterium]|nr:protein-disulfide reductase DsbD [Arenicellales bacterium]
VSAAAAIPAATGSVSELQKLLGIASGEPEFLHPDEAFRLAISPQDATTLVARFQVAPGYYLYREKLDFAAGAGAILSPLTLPPGQSKRDEYFGEVLIYPEDFNIHLPLMRVDNTGQITIIARYQGCAEQGLCYPPVEKTFTLSLPTLVADAQAAATAGSPATTSVALIAYLAAAFGTGLLLSFTPCVLPLIPILASSIVGQARVSRTRGLILSLAYVLGTAATYAVIGAVAGATGEQLQAYFQNIWAISAIAVILALMALSMFGFYQLQMPAILQSRLSEGSTRLGGSLGMTFGLGAVSALIVGACVSPLLISVLGIAILKGDPWLGAALMFAMALGMGVILVAVGAGAGFLVPRAGAWMEQVKQVFGVLLLGVAVYLLGAVPVVPVLLLWSALLIITGVYLGATQAVPTGASGWRYLTKGIGTLLLVWGVLAMIGGFSGNRDILKPVSWQNLATPRGTPSPDTPATALHFNRVHNLP